MSSLPNADDAHTQTRKNEKKIKEPAFEPCVNNILLAIANGKCETRCSSDVYIHHEEKLKTLGYRLSLGGQTKRPGKYESWTDVSWKKTY
jgi:hypothetical protein